MAHAGAVKPSPLGAGSGRGGLRGLLRPAEALRERRQPAQHEAGRGGAVDELDELFAAHAQQVLHLAALALVRKLRPHIPFILVSGTVGEDGAIDSLKSGATDYVLKTRLIRLGPAVRRALKEAELIAERKKVEELFQKILENLEDLISVVDLRGRRVFCSPSYRYICDDPKALIGADAFEEIVAEDRERIRRIFIQTSSTGQAQRAEK